jgi:nicotinamidase/pyrazinamidase
VNALLLIDLQNDFLPGGAVPVPHADAVPRLANQLQGAFKLAVATQDWHPANHKSFASSHPGRKPGDTALLRKARRTLWPAHCVQNTRGAELTPALMLNRVNKVFRKGIEADLDGYSAFFDDDHLRATGLHEYLQDKRVTDVYLMGLGTELCVKATALDAVALGFRTFLIEDACRSFSPDPAVAKGAIVELREAGVAILQCRDLLAVPGDRLN